MDEGKSRPRHFSSRLPVNRVRDSCRDYTASGKNLNARLSDRCHESIVETTATPGCRVTLLQMGLRF